MMWLNWCIVVSIKLVLFLPLYYSCKFWCSWFFLFLQGCSCLVWRLSNTIAIRGSVREQQEARISDGEREKGLLGERHRSSLSEWCRLRSNRERLDLYSKLWQKTVRSVFRHSPFSGILSSFSKPDPGYKWSFRPHSQHRRLRSTAIPK